MRVVVCLLSYGSMIDSALASWLGRISWAAARDPRITHLDFAEVDLPDTSTARNRCVDIAQRLGSDTLVMLDHDTIPHEHFLTRSLEFLRAATKPSCVVSPYIGVEHRPACFDFTDNSEVLRPFGEDAFQQAGMREIAAAGLGACAISMSCFVVVPAPAFSWRWSDDRRHQFSVGEDVVFSILLRRHGGQVVADFSAWADHRKRVILRRPTR